MVNPKSRRSQAAATFILVGFVCGCAQRPAPPPPPLPVPTASQPCPQWTDFPENLNSNQESPYLGCTTHWNLRAQLANPADLDRGRPLGPADGPHAAAAVDAYRQGKVKSSSGSGSFTPAVATPGSSATSGS
jgi:hypothetical protein